LADGTGRFIKVRVHTGSSRREVVLKGGGIHVYTRKKPEKGEANLDVVRIISEYFRVPKSAVELVRGDRAKVKLLRVTACSGADKGSACKKSESAS
jgi:uncharacterized protein YggU (UPF0235/DUF167 family)